MCFFLRFLALAFCSDEGFDVTVEAPGLDLIGCVSFQSRCVLKETFAVP